MSIHFKVVDETYTTSWLLFTSKTRSTRSGLSSGSTSNVCLQIWAYSSFGRSIVISLSVILKTVQVYQVEGNDMSEKWPWNNSYLM